MPRAITKLVYQFDELSESAKEKARDWWRGGGFDEWWESIYEDAERVHIQIKGFDLDHPEIKGVLTIEPHLVADEIINEHGDQCETYKTATEFLEQRDKLIDEWPKDEDGEFEDEYELDSKLDDLEAEFLHDILEDYRIMLGKEWDYINSDEAIDEAIRINEYEFYEDGKRA